MICHFVKLSFDLFVTFYHLKSSWRFWAKTSKHNPADLPLRRIKKINLPLKLQLQSLHWLFGLIETSPFPPSTCCFPNTKKLYFGFTCILKSSLPLPRRAKHFIGQFMTADDSIKCQCTHSGMTGQVGGFQNPGVCLQAFPYLYSLPPPCYFYSRRFFAWSRSSFFALKRHGFQF